MIRRAFSMLILALALPGAVPAAQPPSPGDDELLAMGREIPGFGGMFYDAAGYPTVYLRDPAAPAARLALKRLGGGEARVLRGDYDFSQLVEWKRALRPVLLGRPGVVLLDADEARNRVVVGIDPARAKSLDLDRLDQELDRQGVPRAAVVYEPVPVVHDLAGPLPDPPLEAARTRPVPTVHDAVRPIPGGVELTFLNPPHAYACTIGFNAYLGGAFGFVTNSHCTKGLGTVDGTLYSQGSNIYSPPVAVEIADPAYSSGGDCPVRMRCRSSDSSFARYNGNPTRLGSLGKLAKPTSRDALEGSITLKPAGTRFNIVGTGTASVGQVVNKVGITTGWTFGPVARACIDLATDNDVVLFCQTLVAAGSDHGDSGSPVFSWTTGTSATLLGILWGGGTSNGRQVFAYSPFDSIQQELGTLRVR